MQKMNQFRRLKLEEVKVLAEEGIELNAVEYQRQVEEREAQRRKEREERLAREALMALQAMEQKEQKAAVAAASIGNEGTTRIDAIRSELAGHVSDRAGMPLPHPPLPSSSSH